MKFAPKLVLFLLLQSILFLPLLAQDTGNHRIVTPLAHISKVGGFGIMLDPEYTAMRKIEPSGGIKGGYQFYWKTLDGDYFVSFYDNASKPGKIDLEAMRDNYLADMLKNGGKLLEKKDVPLDNNIGLEIRVSLKSNETAITRYYLVEKRTFILSTRWKSSETGEKQLKILDTFVLMKGK